MATQMMRQRSVGRKIIHQGELWWIHCWLSSSERAADRLSALYAEGDLGELERAAIVRDGKWHCIATPY